MALLYQPKPRSVVMCDFVGFIQPEMVKVRPVVILSRHKHNRNLVTVVPLSTTEPTKMEDHHHELSTNPLPDKPHTSCWAKCDMVATVSLVRLDRYQIGRNQYVVPEVSAIDFEAIRAGVASALHLTDN
ncbi:MAG: hypothetical protein RL018_1802 [Pseudomonadota bacterium]|jgi:uncharacterized protein YifN (PemK superfamily)